MYKLIYIIFLFIGLSPIYGKLSESSYINFADAILFPSTKKFVCLIHINSYAKSEDIPKSKYNFFKNPLASKFMTSTKSVRLVESIYPFCIHTDSIIFLKEINTISMKTIRNIFPIITGDKCLLVLESIYDASCKNDEKKIDEIYNYSFINAETFFKIRDPQTDNAVRLFRNTNNVQIPEHLRKTQEDMRVVDDIKILSKLFCDRDKYEFLDGISDIDKILPSLQSDMGKQIAQKMIEILEKKIIDIEFPKKAVDEIENSKSKLNLEAAEKMFKGKN